MYSKREHLNRLKGDEVEIVYGKYGSPVTVTICDVSENTTTVSYVKSQDTLTIDLNLIKCIDGVSY